MLAEMPALPFSTRDRVTRVTRRCSAAADTGIFPKYSRSTRPGCGGLCILIATLVIIVMVNEHRAGTN